LLLLCVCVCLCVSCCCVGLSFLFPNALRAQWCRRRLENGWLQYRLEHHSPGIGENRIGRDVCVVLGVFVLLVLLLLLLLLLLFHVCWFSCYALNANISPSALRAPGYWGKTGWVVVCFVVCYPKG
jgi:hypothetical protein